jgi:hypothetical protein
MCMGRSLASGKWSRKARRTQPSSSSRSKASMSTTSHRWTTCWRQVRAAHRWNAPWAPPAAVSTAHCHLTHPRCYLTAPVGGAQPAGTKPQRVVNHLWNELGRNQTGVSGQIPTRTQVEHRQQFMSRNLGSKAMSEADMQLWAANNAMPLSKVDVERLPADQVMVLPGAHTPRYPDLPLHGWSPYSHHLWVYTEGVGVDVLVFSSPRILGNVLAAVKDWNGVVPIKCDGTHSMTSRGLQLLCVGTHTVRLHPMFFLHAGVVPEQILKTLDATMACRCTLTARQRATHFVPSASR